MAMLPLKPVLRIVIRLLAFLALFAAVVPARMVAQTRGAPGGSQFMVRSWQIEDGLPQNTVSDIVQTRDGYLWFATEEGLARFNGEKFRVFEAANEPAFEASQSIRSLALGRNGDLWIGTEGAGVVRRHDGRFESLHDELHGSGAQVVALHAAGDGRVWASAAASGLWLYEQSGAARRIPLPDSATVFEATTDASGRAYVATSIGLFEVGTDGAPRRLEVLDADEDVKTVYVDNDNRLWVSGRSRTYVLETRGSPRVHARTSALSFLQDRTGEMWFGLDGAGLLTTVEGRDIYFTSESGLTHNRVVSLFQDAEGSVWVGTEGGGVLQFSRGKFSTYGEPEGLASDLILAVLAASDGTIWAGTEGHGLVSVGNSGIRNLGSEQGLRDDIVTSLAESADGTIWVGTFFGGLTAVRNHRVVRQLGAADGLPEGAVAALFSSRDGSLWIGTDGGLSRLDASGMKTYNTNDGLGSNYVTAIREDQGGTVWVGTYDGGLFTLDDGGIAPVDAVPTTTITSIAEDEDGLLWISTSQDGVFVLGGERPRQLSRSNGLPSNTIYAVVFDDHGHAWMSSNKGLFSVSRASALEDETIRALTFGTLDGLRSVEFNGGVQPAGTKAPDGSLWFPSIKGLVSTSAYGTDGTDMPPPLSIEGVRVKGEDRSLDEVSGGSLNLSPGEDKLEVDVAAITFRGHDRVRIEYRLEGQDEEWSTIASGQTITYTNLSPKQYRLRIRTVVSGMEGDLFGGPTIVAVSLRPFIYEQPIFWAIVVILVLSGSVAGHRVRLRRMRVVERARQRTLERQVAERTHELSELNEKLEEKVEEQVESFMAERKRYERSLLAARDRAEESEALKTTLLTNLTHEFRTPISTIVGFSDILCMEADEQGREFLGYIRQSADRLLATLSTIVDLSELETRAVRPRATATVVCPIIREVVEAYREQSVSSGVGLEIACSDEKAVAWVDPSLFQKVIANVVGNALKFSRDGTVRIRLDRENDHVRIAVSDSGIGISRDYLPQIFDAFTQESTGPAREFEGCGLGLTVVKRLIDISGGTVDVQSEKGIGSTFTITLPSRNVQMNPDRAPQAGAIVPQEDGSRAQPRERSTARRQSSSIDGSGDPG